MSDVDEISKTLHLQLSCFNSPKTSSFLVEPLYLIQFEYGPFSVDPHVHSVRGAFRFDQLRIYFAAERAGTAVSQG